MSPLSFLPLSHVFERTVLYIYLWRGVAVSFARGVETVAEDIREVRPTIVTAVPTRLFERICGTINKRVSEAKLRPAGRSSTAPSRLVAGTPGSSTGVSPSGPS
jgi:long-subunit acyl-CoA synthetase (AMP-forming)